MTSMSLLRPAGHPPISADPLALELLSLLRPSFRRERKPAIHSNRVSLSLSLSTQAFHTERETETERDWRGFLLGFGFFRSGRGQ